MENANLIEIVDLAMGPMLIPLPVPENARKKDLKVVEEFESDRYKVTVYRYKITNYGYTLTPLTD